MTLSTTVSYCRICEANCGVLVDVDIEQDLIVKVRGDADHPSSRGYICPKGSAMGKVVHDPDRLLNPVRRGEDGQFHDVTWDEALDEIAARLSAIVAEHGAEAIAVYSGNPLGFGPASYLWNKKFVEGVGTTNTYGAATQDTNSKYASCYYLFGNPIAIPIPDIAHTDFLLCLGANPFISHGSLVSTGRIKDQMRDIPRRGGRVVVVDPARTATAKAFEHVPIIPGGDVWLLGAILQEIFSRGLASEDARGQASGWDELETAVQMFTPEAAAARCGIEAEQIVQLAHDLVEAPRAVVYGRIGVSRGRYATLCNFFVDAINVVTGNFDRRGGSLLGTGIIDWPVEIAKRGRGTLGTASSRIGGLPEVNGRRAYVLAEEITTPGDGQVRGVFFIAGNPVASAPDGNALRAALDQLDLLVSMDFFVNESNETADFVLPATTFFERPDVLFVTGSWMPRPWTQYTPAVLTPRGEARDEWWIIEELLKRLGRPTGQDPWDVIRAMIESSDFGDGQWTLERIAAETHGVELGGDAPVGGAGEKIRAFTHGATDKVNLGAPEILAEVDRLAADVTEAAEFVLVTRRELGAINSWMHNIRASSGRGPTLHMNPDDARRLGIEDRATARVSSVVGSVEVEIEVTDTIRAGVVNYPYAYGHTGHWKTAVARGGANINTVIPNSVETKERISSSSFLDGVPVDIELVANP